MTSALSNKDRNELPLVSVIVPIYNTAQYIPQCLDAILCQTLSSFEVICVDDGSTDNSCEVVRQFVERDDRIRLICQENQHAGVARNNGLSHARGEYVIFCDSDDHIEPKALELLFSKSKEDAADIAVCGCKQYFERIDLEVNAPSYLRMDRIPEEVPFDRRSNPEYIFSFSTVMTHNKMYRTDFLRDHGLRYSDTRNGEDVFFSVMALWCADRITVVDQYLVSYRLDRPGSLVSTLRESALDPLEAWVKVWRAIGGEPGFPKRSFDNKFVGVVRHTFRNINDGEGCRRCFEYLRGGILDELQIVERPGDYYAGWINEFVRHLRSDSFEGFLAHLLAVASRSLEEESARKRAMSEKEKAARRKARRLESALKKRDGEIARLKSSRSYRLSRCLVKPFRVFRRH